MIFRRTNAIPWNAALAALALGLAASPAPGGAPGDGSPTPGDDHLSIKPFFAHGNSPSVDPSSPQNYA